jgi:hypothetical protein
MHCHDVALSTPAHLWRARQSPEASGFIYCNLSVWKQLQLKQLAGSFVNKSEGATATECHVLGPQLAIFHCVCIHLEIL